MVATEQPTKHYLSKSDRQLIAAIIDRSDFPEIINEDQIITIQVVDGIAWIRTCRCWIAFDRTWFKAQVTELKAELKVKESPKPQRQPRSISLMNQSGWFFDARQNLAWKVIRYRVVGDTGNLYHVTIDTRGEVSCTCKGHKHHHHCYHAAAAMRDWREFQDYRDAKNSDDLADDTPF